MNINEHTTPAKLEYYSFMWSEVRLVIAAIALFVGGIPPIYLLLGSVPGIYGLLQPLLVLSWLVSGAASGYMAYRWNKGGQMLFGKKEQNDTYAFFVSVVSGINLGLTGLLGNNIGMSISHNKTIFLLVGLLYLASAGYLWKRWNSNNHHIF